MEVDGSLLLVKPECGEKDMERMREEKLGAEGAGASWSRRSFFVSFLSGMGMVLARIGKVERAAAVSIKEASHYIPWDPGKGE